ncbi:hypothetical protein CS022_04760 [Veronia nyctiphanis]|uniref:Uncharacterized protein n=1 Tax=Veronia nyctiphanis TaxID=1278244 RepID=A0A4Q0YYR2_9GAMM|nr:response regulator [Veronia nyctiphanis]RXJ74359.1 hypothetical protein CS022_04760 [Veronia nyctiphanis]
MSKPILREQLTAMLSKTRGVMNLRSGNSQPFVSLHDALNISISTRTPPPKLRKPVLANAASEGGNILLAEDVAANQLFAKRVLSKLGFTVDIAENGKQAVEKWKQGTYDVILMDCLMPVMDGYQATTQIREIEKREQCDRRVPIVAVTANTMQNDRQTCLDAGMDDFLAKPFSEVELNTIIGLWMNSAEPRFAKFEQNTSESSKAIPNAPYWIDEQAFQSFVHEMGRDLPEFIKEYRNQISSLESELKDAESTSDLFEYRRLVHNVKSTSATIGMEGLATIAGQIEQLCKIENAFANHQSLSALKEHITYVLEFLVSEGLIEPKVEDVFS